jgi:cell wall-associated NlpC family hydrolase
MKQNQNIWSKYLSIPFVDSSSTFDGCSCWGLIRLAYKTELGIELPEYAEIKSTDLIRIIKELTTEAEKIDPWLPVAQDRILPFDVCLMYIQHKRTIGHVGIVTHNKKVLHTEKGVGVALVPLNHYTIRERIAGFRRHRNVVYAR